jgi:Rv0078B-related antitoxin
MDELEQRRMRNNLLTAFKLHETGVMIMRQNLKRQYPDESDEQIRGRLRAWLHREGLPGPGNLPGFRRRLNNPRA